MNSGVLQAPTGHAKYDPVPGMLAAQPLPPGEGSPVAGLLQMWGRLQDATPLESDSDWIKGLLGMQPATGITKYDPASYLGRSAAAPHRAFMWDPLTALKAIGKDMANSSTLSAPGRDKYDPAFNLGRSAAPPQRSFAWDPLTALKRFGKDMTAGHSEESAAAKYDPLSKGSRRQMMPDDRAPAALQNFDPVAAIRSSVVLPHAQGNAKEARVPFDPFTGWFKSPIEPPVSLSLDKYDPVASMLRVRLPQAAPTSLPSDSLAEGRTVEPVLEENGRIEGDRQEARLLADDNEQNAQDSPAPTRPAGFWNRFRWGPASGAMSSAPPPQPLKAGNPVNSRVAAPAQIVAGGGSSQPVIEQAKARGAGSLTSSPEQETTSDALAEQAGTQDIWPVVYWVGTAQTHSRHRSYKIHVDISIDLNLS